MKQQVRFREESRRLVMRYRNGWPLECWHNPGLSERQMLDEFRFMRNYDKSQGLKPNPKAVPTLGPYATLYQREEVDIAKRVKDGNSVLDVGAGWGRIIDRIKNRVSKAYALDPDANAAEALDRKFREEIASGKVVILKTSAEQIPLSDSSVDVVLSTGNTIGMLWRVEKDGTPVSFQANVIREMLRVARREVVFIVHSKELLWSSLLYYRETGTEVYAIKDGLIFVQGVAAYDIANGQTKAERFVFQKFDEQALRRTLLETGLSNENYTIESYLGGAGFFVTINKHL